MRVIAAGERREPAGSIAQIHRSLRSWRQDLSPAHADSQLFPSRFPPGSLCSPGANTLSRFALNETSKSATTISTTAHYKIGEAHLKWRAMNAATKRSIL